MSKNESSMFRDDALLERRANLSPEKLALLEKIKGSKLEAKPTGIQRRSGKGAIPLSFAQQRLWFLDQLVPNSPAYNVVMAFHLSGRLDAGIMEQCINEIVKRHESLRTTFPSANGQPCQVIAPALNLELPVVDLTKYPDSEKESKFQEMARAESGYVFDLSQGPLLRACLYRLGGEKHILLLNIHHIIIDGWSMGIFFKELTVLYQAFSKGKPSPFPEIPIQYADFSLWQRQWLQGDVLESQLAYWREKLGKEQTVLELATDRTRPPVQTFRGGSLKFQLPSSLSRSIKTVSEQENATLFMVLITALKILLHRYTGQNDIVVGTPIANRNKVEIENLIGFFVNTLVLKTDLSGNPSFTELLGRVREVSNGAYMHQDVPFEVLVDELQPERNMSQNPLFQVCFVLQNIPVEKNSNIPELDFSFEKGEEIRNGTSKFDLWIQVIEKDDILNMDVEYNSDIFNESTIIRMLESYKTLLQGIVSNVHQRISDLPIMTDEEQHKLLVEWNATATNYSKKDMCLHEIIESQAASTPNAPAVIFEDEQLTYAELNQRSNQLANYLSKMGVGAEILVGICMERSIEMVVGLLGILKAGGAYVPLDPTYPYERVAFMMEDSDPLLLLTQQRLLSTLPEHRAKTICVDSDWTVIGQESGQLRGSSVTSENLAYMIYTSGSTGKPKGAMNTHRGIVNRLLWMQEQYRINETDRVMQKTPFSFDVSVWEFFWPLMTGACMVVARPEGHKDTTYLARLIKKEKITTMHFVPSMLQVFLEEKEIEGCDTLKRVVCSGEALSFSIQERFFSRLEAELHNLYGPTEAAVDVTYWACRKDSEQRIVPIGRPVANTQIYILDQNLEPVPIGVPGELHIGGVQLARGYHKRPELTAEKFIPDPFSKDSKARLYKTGDLARYMPDGNIEYLGRIDFQVKLRGFRIELGEIEAVLEGHPSVQKAAVIVHEPENLSGHKQLAAYVIPDEQAAEKAKSVSGEELSRVQVTEWQNVFDKAYTDDQEMDADFNISSWNSSYTGLPLLAEEMREWVDSTVERILDLQPRKAIEIGCGTGLLLSRIAPYCEDYLGTDFSTTALDYINQRLLTGRKELSNVKLLKRNADDFSGIEGQNFDVIILNSVVQYFPDIKYLTTILKKSVQLITDTGAVFIGDVRSLPLLETFHTDVEFEKAPDSLTVEQLKHRARKRVGQEQELAVDPEFFIALQKELPAISHVEVKLKHGTYHNELTRYRYDVVLHVGKKVQFLEENSWLDWQKDKVDVNKLYQLLTENGQDILGITNVPNARLEFVNRRLALLSEENCPGTVGELKQLLRQDNEITGIDPEDWWKLGDELGYTVDIAWMDGATDGSYEVLLKRKSLSKETGGTTLVTACPCPGKSYRIKDCYANNPLLNRLTSQLVPELRSYLKEKLPDHMIPSTFMVIKEMPVNSNGKLDRKVLPLPVQEVPEMEENYVAPRTTVEKILAEVWAEILGLNQVGIKNSFFELGGDSIHSIQVVARVRQRGIQITPQQILQYRTIADLAEVISPTLVNEAKELPTTESGSSLYAAHPDFSLAGLSQEEMDRLHSEIPDLEDVYPLTVMQERMLYQHLTAPQPGLYLTDHLYLIKGEEFNPSAFVRAWKHVINHYPVLRTSYIWKSLKEPLQVVHKQTDVDFDQKDWRGISPDMQKEQLKKHLEDIRRRGFELDRAPHTYLALIRVADDSFYFIHTFSLMLQDGWSFPLIMRTAITCYKAFSEGREIELEPVPPYRNFIAWQKQQDLSGAERFWKRSLNGITLPTLALGKPIGEPASDEEPTVLKEVHMMPEELNKALLSLVKQLDITLNTLVQGAWALLLSKYSGKEDVVFGTIFSGRNANVQGIEHGIGLFFNILPVRIQVNPNVKLLTWLQELQAKVVETSCYEYTPLRKIYDWCGISKEHLLFESYLVSEQLPELLPVLDQFWRLGISMLEGKAQTENPLRVEIMPSSQGLMLNIVYYQCYFNREEVTRMLENLQVLLEGFVAHPEQSLGELMRLI